MASDMREERVSINMDSNSSCYNYFKNGGRSGNVFIFAEVSYLGEGIRFTFFSIFYS
jgi:hypothetical protein